MEIQGRASVSVGNKRKESFFGRIHTSILPTSDLTECDRHTLIGNESDHQLSEQSRKQRALGIIGGTGLYELEGFKNVQWIQVDSAFGKPSDELLIGELDGQRLVFLPRHGRGHRLSPTHVNYRANIEAMKRVGVTRIISFSAVGSLTEHLRPGDFVVVDQYIDRTFAREKSFFGAGMAAHVSMADPVCPQLGEVLERAAASNDMSVTRGGTYLVMEGPQFSTRAESELYRTWGCDVIGMTNMPEAKLAREAEICYATVAMVTDYDCWHPHHEDVSAKSVLEVLHDNAGLARSLVNAAATGVTKLAAECPAGCHRALEHAIATAPDARDPAVIKRLSVVAGRVLANEGWASV